PATSRMVFSTFFGSGRLPGGAAAGDRGTSTASINAASSGRMTKFLVRKEHRLGWRRPMPRILWHGGLSDQQRRDSRQLVIALPPISPPPFAAPAPAPPRRSARQPFPPREAIAGREVRATARSSVPAASGATAWR